MPPPDFPHPPDLLEQHGEGREALVALEDHAPDRGAGQDVIQQRPDLGRRGGRVAVDQELALPVAADEVELDDAIERQAIEERDRVEAVIDRVDVEVRDVQEQAAAGPIDEFRQEFRLLEFGAGALERIGDVLEDQRGLDPSWTSRMFAASTSRPCSANGTGARWPIATPPARVNATCSLHHGGSSRRTSFRSRSR